MKKSLFSALLPALLALSAAAGPYDAWTRYRTLSVNTTAAGANIASSQANFPLLVRLTNASAATGKDVLDSAKAGGADIRFTTANGNTALPYEIERWTATGAEIWVRVPVVAGNATTTLRLFWGNSAATSASNGAAVFDTANGYEAVFHMNQASGDTLRDATANGYKGVPTVGSTVGSAVPADSLGPIGMAKHFGGNALNTDAGARTGGAYRLETAAGGRTHNSFDYVGNDAQFTISTWTKWAAYSAGGTQRRRGLITKADHGPGQISNDDPVAQWFLRPSNSERVMHFQRYSVAGGYSTTPYSIVPSGGIASAVNNWNYAAYSAGTTADSNLIYLRNGASRNTRLIVDEDGVHRDIDVFIGGFADTVGKKGNGTHFLNGSADEVRIQKVVRSADWLDLEFQTQRSDTLKAVTLGATQVNVPTVAGPWDAWINVQNITLNTSATGANVSGDVTNFPVLIRLTPAEAAVFSAAGTGGASLRFAKSNDSALPYQIERWDATAQRAEIWVKVDTVKGNNSTQFIKMYYGNNAAASQSNGRAVFDTATYTDVWHLGDTTGVAPRPNAITGRFNATPVSFASGYQAPTGLIGKADNLTGGSNADSTTFLAINEGTPTTRYNFGDGMFTYSAWINPRTADNFGRFISILGTDAGNDRIFMSMNNGNIIGRLGVGTTSNPTNSETPPNLGEWNHVAMVFKRGAVPGDTVTLYHNGVQIAQTANAAAVLPNVERPFVRIGKDYINVNDMTYNGLIDETRLSHVARSADYIKLSYASQGMFQKFTNIGMGVATAPEAPVSVTASAGPANSGSVVVSWTAGANGGAAITGYTVTASPGTATCTATPPTTTCTVNGLTPGTPYTFTVKATNSVGTSAASAATSPVTPTGIQAPKNFILSVNGQVRPFTYRLPAAMMANTDKLTMSISDVHGRTVWSRTVNPRNDKVGELTWNGENRSGARVSAGMYLVRVNLVSDGKSHEFTQKAIDLTPSR